MTALWRGRGEGGGEGGGGGRDREEERKREKENRGLNNEHYTILRHLDFRFFKYWC
jgi:hypothetical protein